LATYGIAGHALLKMVGEHDGTRLRSLEARFSAPVYPGETLRTEIWREIDCIVFRTKAIERDVVVLDQGRAELA
jgi:acyl dehydratase